MHFLPLSDRNAMSYARFTSYSGFPLSFLAPIYQIDFGRIFRLPSIFKNFGYLSFISVIIGMFFTQKKDYKSLSLFIIFYLLSIGKFFPGTLILYKIPLINSFRDPHKYNIVVNLYYWLFFLVGIEQISRLKKASIKRIKQLNTFVVSITLIALLLANILIYFYADNILDIGLNYVQNTLVNQGHHPFSIEHYSSIIKSTIMPEIINSIKITRFLFFFLMAGLCMLFFSESKLFRFAPTMILLITTINIFTLIYSEFSIKGITHIQQFEKPPKVLSVLKGNNRLFRYYSYWNINELSGNGDDRIIKELLIPNLNILYGMESVDIGSVTPFDQRSIKFEYLVDQRPRSGRVFGKALSKQEQIDSLQNNLDLLSFANVKYIISTDLLQSTRIHLLKTFQVNKFNIYSYEFYDYYPRFFVINRGKRSSIIDQYKWLEDKKFHDLKRISCKIDILEHDSDKMVLNISCPHNKTLVINQLYHPNWKAKVNGKDVEPYSIHYIHSAIDLPATQYRVEYYYKPW